MAECGTRAGYKRHRKNGEPACEPCTAANADYGRARRKDSEKMARELEQQRRAHAGSAQARAVDFEAKARQLEASRRYRAKPEVKARRAARERERMADPEYRARRYEQGRQSKDRVKARKARTQGTTEETGF